MKAVATFACAALLLAGCDQAQELGNGSTGGGTPATSTGGGDPTPGSGGGPASAGSGGVGAAGAQGGGGPSSVGSGGVGVGGSSPGGGGQGGMPPPPLDPDNDGWKVTDGDCCETIADCSAPERVNPGAFEYLGNGVDDDCDPGTLDNVQPQPCSDPGGQPSLPTSSLELVEAMDLCNSALLNPPTLSQKKWGVISHAIVAADGVSTAPDNKQVGVLPDYGTSVLPKKGPTMAAISSGTARDENDPDYVHPENGPGAADLGSYDAETVSGVPPVWLANNMGMLPATQDCPACVGADCTTAFDSVNLRVMIRVPTNAKSFSYNFKFYSAEYPEYVCLQYNDFFVTLLQTGVTVSPQSCACGDGLCQKAKCPAIDTQMLCPADCADDIEDATLPFGFDGNIAFDSLGNPVSVNNSFFEVCFPQMSGDCQAGTLELAGNGMGGWYGALDDGGGTVWLVNEAPVVPGEIITLEFVTWDAADHHVDSLVLLDNFKWSLDPSQVSTHD
jgi:hypothetical protein